MTDKLLYSFEPLTQYFKQINKSVKGATMLKDTLTRWKEKISLLWTKPVEFVDNEKQEIEDYWSFTMHTGEWTCDGNTVPAKHTFIFEPNDSTWMSTLDKILDVMEEHYGYNIKEQVYYSVKFPTNEIDKKTGVPYEGYGRSLNDERLQLLLLAHPEVYEVGEAE